MAMQRFLAPIGATTLFVATLMADMPAKASPAASALFDWAGFYAGLDAGYLWSDTTQHSLGGFNLHGHPDPDGFIGGGHLGYRYQFTSNYVVGIEGDLGGIIARGRKTYIPATPDLDAQLRLNRDYSVRGIFGWANGRDLFYGTGGVPG